MAVLEATYSEKDTSRFVQAGKIRLHYNDIGSGYPIIAIHGAGPGSNAWSTFKQNIPAFAERHRLILLDMPQHGKSDKVPIEGGRLTFVSRVCRDAMDALGIESAHFIGNSMGGQAAIKLAIDTPERVSRLVAIGSTPVTQSVFSPMPAEGTRMIIDYYRGHGPSREKMRRLMESLLFDASMVNEETLEERYQASVDPEVIRLMSGPAPENEDLWDQLHLLQTKTLLVWGMDDRFGALDVGMLMTRRFQKAEIHVFTDCGHWPQLEHARAFERIVLEFLER